jgi:hypothetical protein
MCRLLVRGQNRACQPPRSSKHPSPPYHDPHFALLYISQLGNERHEDLVALGR